jgi:hypothetical protein
MYLLVKTLASYGDPETNPAANTLIANNDDEINALKFFSMNTSSIEIIF